MSSPTFEERYRFFRQNAEAHVQSMRVIVATLERDGKENEATQLRVGALMPWEAALRDDDAGDLIFGTEWQPVETAPKDGTRVLIWPAKGSHDAKIVDAAYWHQPANPSAKGFWIGLKTNSQPTHWQSLPSPPTHREAG